MLAIAFNHQFIAILTIQNHSFLIRLVPIMLLKLPIMLWSNAPEFCLLFPNYAPYVSQDSPQINISFLLFCLSKPQNHEY